MDDECGDLMHSSYIQMGTSTNRRWRIGLDTAVAAIAYTDDPRKWQKAVMVSFPRASTKTIEVA